MPGDPGDGFEIDAVILLEDSLSPKRSAGDPGLQADTFAVEIRGLDDAAVLVDVDIGVAKHSFDEYRYRGKAQFFKRQIGDVSAGEKFGHVEFTARRALLAIDIVGINGDSEFDAHGFDAALDQGLCPVVRAAGHGTFKISQWKWPFGGCFSLFKIQ